MSEGRYARHALIGWFDQDAMKNASVVVVGAGAIGNEVLKNLALLGIGRIHIIDFDRVEASNLSRAVLFTDNDIGLYKAEVAARAIALLNPDTKTTTDISDLWHSLRLSQLGQFDAVFCCVDNYEARIRLNRLCLLARVDLYNSGIDSRFVSVEKFPFGSQTIVACYECGLPQSAYAHISERYSCSQLRKRAYEEKKIPTTIITSSIAGAQVCSLFIGRKHRNVPSGAIRFYADVMTGNSSLVSLAPNEECSFCSHLCRIRKIETITRKSLVPICRQMRLPDESVIWLSDRIVLRVQCTKCGHSIVLNDVADKYDDGLLYCPKCGLNSNLVDIRDFLTLGELAQIFSDHLLPIKYAWFTHAERDTIMELED